MKRPPHRPTTDHPAVFAAPVPRAARAPVVLLGLALALGTLSGCSFSWGDGGIGDVLFGGRSTGGPSAGGEVPMTDEEIAAAADQNEPPASKADDEPSATLQRIAILPVAWAGEGGGQPCDLCPPEVRMQPTSERQARLVTGFFYEAVARHPRLLFPTAVEVDREVAAAPGRSLRAAAASLASRGRADLVIVSALLELRPRVGPDDDPETPAGIALYASLVDARDGSVLWSDIYDRNESGRGFILRSYDHVMNDRPVRWRSAEEYAEHAADELADDLVDELD